MDDGLIFNGDHCSQYGLEIAQTKRPLLGEFKDTYIDVPFREGAVLVYDNTKRDITVEVEFILEPIAGKTYFDACRDIANWLTTERRAILVFDDDPQFAYRAKAIGNVDRERIAQYGQFTVQFRCEPDMIPISEVTP